MELSLKDKIEAVLFYKGEELEIKELVKILEVSEAEIEKSLEELEKELSNKGVVLMRNGKNVLLSTNSEFSSLIEQIKKEELNKEIGNAGIETLSIVLYKGPITKTEIDYIRGVNSASILRSLLIRGLIEKESSSENKRVVLYKPSFNLLSFMGVKNIEELPAYEEVKSELEEFLSEE